MSQHATLGPRSTARQTSRTFGGLFVAVTMILVCAMLLTACSLSQDVANEPGVAWTFTPAGTPSAGQDYEPMMVTTEVVRVVDGDTIVVRPVIDVLRPTNDAGTQHTVRLLGLDAPEMNFGEGKGDPECGAVAATDHLAELLPTGHLVTLTFDPLADRFDDYGRSLAYVSITGSGSDVNLAQLTGGFAAAWIPNGEPEPERWFNYLSASEQAKYAKTGSYGAPEHCTSLGRR